MPFMPYDSHAGAICAEIMPLNYATQLCHFIVAVAIPSVNSLSFTKSGSTEENASVLPLAYSLYRLLISSSVAFIFSFTASGAAMRTVLPRLNTQPKNC